jgi:hypothetical protein
MLVRVHDCAIGLLIADRHRLLLGVGSQELDISKAIRKRHLLVFGQVLSGKHEDGVVVEGLLHVLPG